MESTRCPNTASSEESYPNSTVLNGPEGVYHSVAYDSGICLSNYRSTDGGSTGISRDLDLVDGPRLEADCCIGSLVPGQPSPVVSSVEKVKVKDTLENGCCFEEQFYEQDEEGDTLLHLAIIKPDMSVAIRMIEMTRISEFLDIQNKAYMHSPLHLAVVTSQPPIVRALVISGASVSLRDRNGNTALHLACKQGDAECVRQLTAPFSDSENRYLQNKGVQSFVIKPMQSSDINVMNYEGESCLHLALFSVAKPGYEIFDYLVTRCSADINTKDGKCGYTVLHEAVKRKEVEMVQFLLRYPQLAINELCYSGNTALDVAVSLNLQRLEMIIRMAGGVCTESTDSSSDDMSDDSQIDDFDDLMIGGLRLNS